MKLFKASKKEISKKQKELNKVCDKKKEYEKHYEHKNVQRECFNKIKQNIPNNTLLLVLDFKENIVLGRGPREINQDFYNREPRTIFGAVAYFFEQDKICKTHFNVVSEILNYDSEFVNNVLTYIMKKKNIF